MLAELEEIISYKQMYDQPERQQLIKEAWTHRLVRSKCFLVG